MTWRVMEGTLNEGLLESAPEEVVKLGRQIVNEMSEDP